MRSLFLKVILANNNLLIYINIIKSKGVCLWTRNSIIHLFTHADLLTGEGLRTSVFFSNRKTLITTLGEKYIWLSVACLGTEGDCFLRLWILFGKKPFNFYTHAFWQVTFNLFLLSQLYKFTWLAPYLSATNKHSNNLIFLD